MTPLDETGVAYVLILPPISPYHARRSAVVVDMPDGAPRLFGNRAAALDFRDSYGLQLARAVQVRYAITNAEDDDDA